MSEDPNVSVAVLEAGGNGLNDILIDGPNLFTQLWGKPQYDWDYKTVPQEGTIGRVHGWVRGKVLGGSSAVNYNMFSMASRQDLDNWAELGNKGWDFDSMVPYYKKFETYHPASETLGKGLGNKYLNKELRGTEGPIHVSTVERGNLSKILTGVDLLSGDGCSAYARHLAQDRTQCRLPRSKR